MHAPARAPEPALAHAPAAPPIAPPPVAAPPDPEAARGDADVHCYVCLEGAEEGELLSSVCGCTTTHVHGACLEKLFNSRARRHLELHERLTCQVCAQQYVIPVAASTADGPSPVPVIKRRCLIFGSSIQLILMGFAAVGVFIVIRIFSVGSIIVRIIVGVVLICMLTFASLRIRGTRASRDPEDPLEDLTDPRQALDDEAYYAQVVRPTRARAKAIDVEATAEVSSKRLLLHVGIGEPLPPRSAAAPPSGDASDGEGDPGPPTPGAQSAAMAAHIF